VQAVNVVNQAGDSSATPHPPTEPPAPKERALMPAGMDKHAKKAHWDQRKAERARARQVSTAMSVTLCQMMFAIHDTLGT